MNAAQVQRESGPSSPPLPALYPRGVEFAGVERVEPDQTVGERVRDTYQPGCVAHTPHPGIRMQRRGGRRRLRRAILGLVLREVSERACSVDFRDVQAELVLPRLDGAPDAHGAQHEGAILAILPPRRAVNLFAGLDQRMLLRR